MEINKTNVSILSGLAAGVLATVLLINKKKEPKAKRKSRELLQKIQSNAKDLKKSAQKISKQGINQGKSLVDSMATK